MYWLVSPNCRVSNFLRVSDQQIELASHNLRVHVFITKNNIGKTKKEHIQRQSTKQRATILKYLTLYAHLFQTCQLFKNIHSHSYTPIIFLLLKNNLLKNHKISCRALNNRQNISSNLQKVPYHSYVEYGVFRENCIGDVF